ncbi:MAG: DUF2231 domain-containing protein [candidate division Zixibacteria bacterium]|nr:DUF2231 domain-containing protein [candidate division Zixibacteria bacterium]
MNLIHPTIVHLAIALFIMSMICEALSLITSKKTWPQFAKYYIGASAVMSFIAIITGSVDYRTLWMTEYGYIYLQTHMILGVLVFFIIQLLANYRILLQKMLPKSAFTAYLILCGICLGLLSGTASLGKTGVYKYGAGVSAAMLNRLETEEYLKKQYQLAAIPALIDKDSLAVLSANLTAFSTEDILYAPSDSMVQDDREPNSSELEMNENHPDSPVIDDDHHGHH